MKYEIISRRAVAIGLCSIVLSATSAPSAFASGGAAAAAIIGASLHNRADQQQVPRPPAASDGFLDVKAYFREGPAFRLCPQQTGKKIVALQGSCAIAHRVRDGFFSVRGTHYKYEPVDIALDPQSYLDMEYGAGTTVFAGLSSRSSGTLVLFYRHAQAKP